MTRGRPSGASLLSWFGGRYTEGLACPRHDLARTEIAVPAAKAVTAAQVFSSVRPEGAGGLAAGGSGQVTRQTFQAGMTER